MKINNRIKRPLYNTLNLFLICALAIILSTVIFEVYFYRSLTIDIFSTFCLGFLFIICLFIIEGRHVFEFDSEGEMVEISNANAISFLRKKIYTEVPRKRFKHFEVVDLFLIKRLYVYVGRKNSKTKLLTYNISFLTKSEISLLQDSLNLILQQNKDVFVPYPLSYTLTKKAS